MWAITWRIPYVTNYNASQHPKTTGFGVLNAHALATSTLKPPHHHLVYEALDGDIVRCKFSWEQPYSGPPPPAKGQIVKYSQDMRNLEDNFYNPNKLAPPGREPPKSWPPAWPWPHDPQTVNPAPNGPFGPCNWCLKETVSWPIQKLTHDNTRCKCTRADGFLEIPPNVQIKQLPPFTAANELNRGVVTRSEIRRDEVLGEYLGVFIHVDTVDFDPDQNYQFAFEGPLDQDSSTGRWCLGPKTSILVGGLIGNWTRFINSADGTDKKNNVEYQIYALAGQLRIAVVALKNIRFGEELLVDYGPLHRFGKDGQEIGGV